jgi:hypothetical protein
MVLKVLFDGSFDGFIKRMPKNPAILAKNPLLLP